MDDFIEAAREERRYGELRQLVADLYRYLGKDESQLRDQIIAQAGKIYNFSLGDGFAVFLDLLKAGNHPAWAQLLLLARETFLPDYERLKSCSPFPGQLLLFVNHRSFGADPFTTPAFTGDLETWLRTLFEKRGIKLHTGLKSNWVMVALPTPGTRRTITVPLS